MGWDTLLDDLTDFALSLLRLPETERTGQALFDDQTWFLHTWSRDKSVSSSGQIPVPPPRNKALHPTGCDISGAYIQFQFKLGDTIDVKKVPALSQFQVRVTGDAAYELCLVELEDHWRVDTHDFQGSPREPHALIHFQRGGHSQDAWAAKANYVPGPALPQRAGDDYWQALLQSPGPRVPFLPLCPILAIDYVIGQHDGDIWDRLRNSSEYRTIVGHAQERLWLPFFEGLSSEGLRRRWLGPMLL